MSRRWLQGAVVLSTVLALLLGGCQPAATQPPPANQPATANTQAPAQQTVTNKVLRLLTWEGYAPDTLVQKFKQETGIDVQITYIGDNNELIAKLAATKGTGFDLAQPTFNWVTRAQEDNQIYQPIDLSKVKTDQIIASMLDLSPRALRLMESRTQSPSTPEPPP